MPFPDRFPLTIGIIFLRWPRFSFSFRGPHFICGVGSVRELSVVILASLRAGMPICLTGADFFKIIFLERSVIMIPRKLEKGQGLTEYGLAIILVAIVVLGVLQVLGISIGDYYTYIIDNLPFS